MLLLGNSKRVLVSLFFTAILFTLTACPGVIIDHIQISFAGGSALVGATGTFTCISPVNQSVVTYRWTFGDGATATGQTVTHSYASGGVFIVECRVVTVDSVLIFSKFLTIPNIAIYWTNANDDTIGRANLDGTGVDNNFFGTGNYPVGIAVDDNFIYWINFLDSTVGRANLDGTGVNNNFFGTGISPDGLTIDSNFIYWANSSDDTIGRANLDGTGVNNNFISTGDTPTRVEVGPAD